MNSVEKILFISVVVILGIAGIGMLSVAAPFASNPINDVWQVIVDLCQATCGG